MAIGCVANRTKRDENHAKNFSNRWNRMKNVKCEQMDSHFVFFVLFTATLFLLNILLVFVSGFWQTFHFVISAVHSTMYIPTANKIYGRFYFYYYYYLMESSFLLVCYIEQHLTEFWIECVWLFLSFFHSSFLWLVIGYDWRNHSS